MTIPFIPTKMRLLGRISTKWRTIFFLFPPSSIVIKPHSPTSIFNLYNHSFDSRRTEWRQKKLAKKKEKNTKRKATFLWKIKVKLIATANRRTFFSFFFDSSNFVFYEIRKPAKNGKKGDIKETSNFIWLYEKKKIVVSWYSPYFHFLCFDFST